MYAYNELMNKFNRSTNLNKREYKLENNTYAYNESMLRIISPFDEKIIPKEYITNYDNFSIILHGSIIAKITLDKIVLDNCGWASMTTKDRMNKILDDNQVNYRIYQNHFTWFIYPLYNHSYPMHKLNEQCVKFYNGITFIYDYNCKLGNGWIINTE